MSEMEISFVHVTLGVLQMLKQHPEIMKEGFIHQEKHLSGGGVEAIFQLPSSAWSEAGSNRHRNEKRTLTHWRDLLQDLEG